MQEHWLATSMLSAIQKLYPQQRSSWPIMTYQPYQGQQKQIHSLQEIDSLVCVCYYPHKHCSSAHRLDQDHLWFSQGAPVSYYPRAYCKEIHFILSLHCQVSVLLTSIGFTANLGDLINPTDSYWFDFPPNRKVVIVWIFFLRFLVRLFKSSRWWCSKILLSEI